MALATMVVDFSRLLPHQQDLYLCTEGMDLPEIFLDLAMWSISANGSRQRSFQKRLPTSWKTKTSKSYNSLFQKWVGWCKERDSDPISGPTSEVANFLAHLFELGYQYRSLNAYHSAISSTHNRVDGFSMDQHPTITHLLVRAQNSRPPLPKYSATWDVQKVLTHLEKLGHIETLSRDLMHKTTMLLALTRPSRSADLCQLDLAYSQKTSHSNPQLYPNRQGQVNQWTISFSMLQRK